MSGYLPQHNFQTALAAWWKPFSNSLSYSRIKNYIRVFIENHRQNTSLAAKVGKKSTFWQIIVVNCAIASYVSVHKRNAIIQCISVLSVCCVARAPKVFQRQVAHSTNGRRKTAFLLYYCMRITLAELQTLEYLHQAYKLKERIHLSAFTKRSISGYS